MTLQELILCTESADDEEFSMRDYLTRKVVERTMHRNQSKKIEKQLGGNGESE
jgi:hypothetical protein